MNNMNNNVGRSDPQPPNLGGSSDLIIIGAGPGGYRAAEYAAKQGLKVTIFEGSDVGGTCLNVGCIPTKTYVHSKTFEEARERMAQVVPQLRSGVEVVLSHPNITLIRENAHFESLTEGTVPIVRIQAGGESYETDNVIIATPLWWSNMASMQLLLRLPTSLW